MKKVYIITSSSAFDTLSAGELLYGNAYYAKQGRKFGTNDIALNGESVGRVPDLIGNLDINYKGVTNAPLIGGAPRKSVYSDKETYIGIPNIPGLMYAIDNEFSPPIGYPREFGEVFRLTETQSYEQLQDAFATGDGLGLNNTLSPGGIVTGATVRIANQQAVDGASIDFYKKVFVQISFESDRARLFINGAYAGQVPNTFQILKKLHGFFVGTNNAAHQWFAQYHANRLFTDAERLQAANEICAKFGCNNTYAPFPLAYNVKQSLSGGNWTRSYLTRNAAGNGINDAATQTRWILNIRRTGSFEFQKVIAEGATLSSAALASAYEAYRVEIGASLSDQKFIAVEVKAYDNNGFGWQYLRGTDYTQF